MPFAACSCREAGVVLAVRGMMDICAPESIRKEYFVKGSYTRSKCDAVCAGGIVKQEEVFGRGEWIDEMRVVSDAGMLTLEAGCRCVD